MVVAAIDNNARRIKHTDIIIFIIALSSTFPVAIASSQLLISNGGSSNGRGESGGVISISMQPNATTFATIMLRTPESSTTGIKIFKNLYCYCIHICLCIAKNNLQLTTAFTWGVC